LSGAATSPIGVPLAVAEMVYRIGTEVFLAVSRNFASGSINCAQTSFGFSHRALKSSTAIAVVLLSNFSRPGSGRLGPSCVIWILLDKISIQKHGARRAVNLPEQIVAAQDRHQSTGFGRRQQTNLAEPPPILIGAAKAMLTLAATNPLRAIQHRDRQILP
jgi:hypothetical protein